MESIKPHLAHYDAYLAQYSLFVWFERVTHIPKVSTCIVL